jgi:hypothetical protein
MSAGVPRVGELETCRVICSLPQLLSGDWLKLGSMRTPPPLQYRCGGSVTPADGRNRYVAKALATAHDLARRRSSPTRPKPIRWQVDNKFPATGRSPGIECVPFHLFVANPHCCRDPRLVHLGDARELP